MGLCKCPKRKVTNLFCFEHRVNVCESCLVANHESVGGREGDWRQLMQLNYLVRGADVPVLADRQRLRLQLPAVLGAAGREGDRSAEVLA